MDKPFQRLGSISNAQAGKDFEKIAQEFFKKEGLILDFNLKIPVGIGEITKLHAFDLGCLEQRVLVECKSHKWTSGDNVPSAKLTVWNEAMYYFFAAPDNYRKIMFVLCDFSEKRQESLAEYYLRTYQHLVPSGVEFWEYDEEEATARKLLP
ncbi:hypothetical protein P886_4162 [Alteromonadaceae bacterium 2753L.S.0a.02]|nr:hypothetical protein P886_4162 [Alteromonadaceae bacterium 2753L.S.0a.02]